MQFKLILSEQAIQSQVKISQFCEPQNISQLIRFLVMDDTVNKSREDKQSAVELVRSMLAITAQKFNEATSQEIEIDTTPFSELLTLLTELVSTSAVLD